jgi:hypothetical protein
MRCNIVPFSIARDVYENLLDFDSWLAAENNDDLTQDACEIANFSGHVTAIYFVFTFIYNKSSDLDHDHKPHYLKVIFG